MGTIFMKVLLVLFMSCFFMSAAEPVLSKRGALIYEEAFNEKLSSVWKFGKGNWHVSDGRLIGQEPQGNNHAVHLAFTSEIQGNFIIEMDMLIQSNDSQAGIMFNPGKGSPLKGHIGRVTFSGKLFTVRKDKSKVVKKDSFKKSPAGKWFHLTLEVVDDTVTAQFNKKKYTIKHDDFKKAEKKKIILLAGKTVEYKNFKLYKTIANE